jgi:hypothetical protein
MVDKFILICNDSPVLTMAKTDEANAVACAEEYSTYFRRNVTILRLRGGVEVDVAHLILYKKG